MSKNFSLQKNNNKKSDNHPDYRISIRMNDKFHDAGACWIKKDKNGNNYLSCQFSDRYVDHTDPTKTRDGFHIAIDPKIEEGEATSEEMDYITSDGTDIRDIPF